MVKLAVALALLVAACSPTPSPLPSGLVSSRAPSSNAPSSALASPEVAAIPDGEHRVGVDVQAGTYRVVKDSVNAAEDFCYLERLSGFGGSEAEIIANNAGVGPRVVTIAGTDVGFRSEGCGLWTTDRSPLLGPIGDGVWIVGSDVRPARYLSDGGTACVWQRLSGFGWTSDESIAVGMSGEVTIEAGDVGFSSAHCGDWTQAPS